jgi:hypothetical protein
MVQIPGGPARPGALASRVKAGQRPVAPERGREHVDLGLRIDPEHPSLPVTIAGSAPSSHPCPIPMPTGARVTSAIATTLS